MGDEEARYNHCEKGSVNELAPLKVFIVKVFFLKSRAILYGLRGNIGQLIFVLYHEKSANILT